MDRWIAPIRFCFSIRRPLRVLVKSVFVSVYHKTIERDWHNTQVFCNGVEINMEHLIVADTERKFVCFYEDDYAHANVLFGVVVVKEKNDSDS